jgi:hypothetical protein
MKIHFWIFKIQIKENRNFCLETRLTKLVVQKFCFSPVPVRDPPPPPFPYVSHSRYFPYSADKLKQAIINL